MKVIRRASAKWTGTAQAGAGHLSSTSGVLRDTPYGFGTRFGDVPGTNPEELLAAAHAGCFTMATAYALEQSGLSAQMLSTEARLTLERDDQGFVVSSVHLNMQAQVAGISEAAFRSIAEGAKAQCPVSRLFNCEISLELHWVNAA